MLAAGLVFARTGAAIVLRESPEKASLKNPLFEALGSAKEAVGDTIYLRADEYFHAGMDRNLLSGHRLANEDPNDPNYAVKILSTDWAMKINRQIKVVDHTHLEQPDAKEILPLLYASTVLNPQNLDAVLTAAYWLEKATGEVDQPLEVLQRTAAAHPGQWKIEFAIGEILASKKKDPVAAVPHFDLAADRLTRDNAMPFDWIRVRYARAEALAASGQTERALAAYRETLELADQRPKSALPGVLRQKIKKIEASASVSASASRAASHKSVSTP